jgi:hypothetical protein
VTITGWLLWKEAREKEREGKLTLLALDSFSPTSGGAQTATPLDAIDWVDHGQFLRLKMPGWYLILWVRAVTPGLGRFPDQGPGCDV